jgi:NADH:ubiquinone oxidoreductase, NADH-binding (51 kD) subunit
MGSGGLVVVDEDTCMVDMARFFLEFTQRESCGKCIPCREGTKKMLDILIRITEGKGREEDIDNLIYLGTQIKTASLCGLGRQLRIPCLQLFAISGMSTKHTYSKRDVLPEHARLLLRSRSIQPNASAAQSAQRPAR